MGACQYVLGNMRLDYTTEVRVKSDDLLRYIQKLTLYRSGAGGR